MFWFILLSLAAAAALYVLITRYTKWIFGNEVRDSFDPRPTLHTSETTSSPPPTDVTDKPSCPDVYRFDFESSPSSSSPLCHGDVVKNSSSDSDESYEFVDLPSLSLLSSSSMNSSSSSSALPLFSSSSNREGILAADEEDDFSREVPKVSRADLDYLELQREKVRDAVTIEGRRIEEEEEKERRKCSESSRFVEEEIEDAERGNEVKKTDYLREENGEMVEQEDVMLGKVEDLEDISSAVTEGNSEAVVCDWESSSVKRKDVTECEEDQERRTTRDGGEDMEDEEIRSEDKGVEERDEDNEKEEYEDAEDRQHSSEQRKLATEEAQNLKEEGNEQFREANYEEAIHTYSNALDVCPLEEGKLRAVLFSNRAACHLQYRNKEATIADCTDAIASDPTYAKAYLRRFTVYEMLEKWHDASTDLNKAVELDPSIKPRYLTKLQRVERLSKELFEKEKEEMMGKMKDLGNFLLGKVGLSLDNFKVEKNEDTGSYNIQFQQNAQAPSSASSAPSFSSSYSNSG